MADKRWTAAELEIYGTFRNRFREASANLVRRVLSEHSRGKIIEIGSGLGELVSIVPEYGSRIQQTEESPELVERNRTLNPQSNVVLADAYNLPFPQNSFDTAVSLSTFNVLSDLERALNESSRVLAADGRIIHFRDISFTPTWILERKTDVIPFPYFEPDLGCDKAGAQPIAGHPILSGFRFVKKEYYIQKISKLGELAKFLDEYIKEPVSSYRNLLSNSSRDLMAFSKSLGRIFPDSECVLADDVARGAIETALANAGYSIMHSGLITAEAFATANRQHRSFPTANLFYNRVGNPMVYADSSLKLAPNQVKEMTTMYVAVAQKKTA